jgi:uncharacterized OsmC-like protein
MSLDTKNRVNGIDVDALHGVVEEVREDPACGNFQFRVRSSWTGQTKSRHEVDGYRAGKKWVKRSFAVETDEPVELLGTDAAPSPQELLMAAFNACIMVGYVTGAALRGIRLELLEVETEGELDLRGFLNLDPHVLPGCESVRYTVRIKGDGTPEQFEEIHETVVKTSPNYFTVSRPIRIDATLDVES